MLPYVVYRFNMHFDDLANVSSLMTGRRVYFACVDVHVNSMSIADALS